MPTVTYNLGGVYVNVSNQGNPYYTPQATSYLDIAYNWNTLHPVGEYTQIGFFRFPKSTLNLASKIKSAKLNLNLSNYEGSGTKTLRVGRMAGFSEPFTGFYESEKITGFGSEFATYTNSFFSGDIELDVTARLQAIAEGSAALDGIYVDFSATTGYYKLRVAPISLVVEYDDPPAKPTLTFPNGGEFINGVQDIAWTLGADDNTPTNQLRTQIQISANNGSTWSNIIALTTAGAETHAFNFNSIAEGNLYKVRLRSYDGFTYSAWDESDGVFTVAQNIPPYAPTNLQPSGQIINRLNVVRLSWQHNDQSSLDRQSKADIQWRVQGSSAWNNEAVVGNVHELYLAGGVLPAGQIEWRVRTYDQAELAGVWSNVAVFTSAEPTSAPVIVQPSTLINVSRPIIEWTGGAQESYQIVVEDNLGTILWDTGELISPVKTRTNGFDMVNGATYIIRVRTKDGNGLFSSFTSKTVQVSYTPPKAPIVESYILDKGIKLSWTNLEPDGGEPEVIENEVYKLVAGEWIRIAFGQFRTFTDFDVASEEAVTYKIRAIGDNGTFSDSPNIVQTASKITGMYLYDVLDPNGTIHHFENVDAYTRDEETENEHDFRHYAGREKSVLVYGEFEDMIVNAELHLIKDEIGADKLRSYRKNRSILQYRDGHGRKFYTSIPRLQLLEVYYGYTTQLSFREIDYIGGV